MNWIICPRCEGDGEEPGAPLDLDGVWLCSCCNGEGEVTEKQAQEYLEDDA